MHHTACEMTNPFFLHHTITLDIEGSCEVNSSERKWRCFFDVKGRKWRGCWGAVGSSFMSSTQAALMNNTLDEVPALYDPELEAQFCQGLLDTIVENSTMSLYDDRGEVVGLVE